MTEADRIFDRFPTFIREYIYQRGWDHLRDVQLKAARVILDSDDNLLLSSSTASGKTEAAFFPILAHLYDHPSDEEGASVLYIAPLKSLLNDQFFHLKDFLILKTLHFQFQEQIFIYRYLKHLFFLITLLTIIINPKVIN